MRQKTLLLFIFYSCTWIAGCSVSPTSTTARDPQALEKKSSAQGAAGLQGRRFVELYGELRDPANGYFSRHDIPYHAVETLIVEAPDHGHMTTSESFSYWLLLEAWHGKMTGDFAPLEHAWDTMERHMIPSHTDQPANDGYNPSAPAVYAAERLLPSDYPSRLDRGVSIGSDPIAAELRAAYGTSDVYGMHWLLDVDNWYGYGQRGDGVTSPSYVNTFQRGAEESVWETVPHPSWDGFEFGSGSGFVPLFVGDGSTPAKQWRYTNAPDADARAVQAVYWAKLWADARGGDTRVDALVQRASKMGDYLRYALFDKYFKTIGCTSPSCAAGSGRDSAHYLLSWYYAWGGPTDNASWAWRIGSSHAHFGYQNPLAAYALAAEPAFNPRSRGAAQDWQTSLGRQLELYRWLQSAEGAIAGGVTNSWEGAYAEPPQGRTTFYGMAYDSQPVYHDPGSNTWFGFQAWSMERLAEYLYRTQDPRARLVLDRWISWAMRNTQVDSSGTFAIPAELAWAGQPSANWTESDQSWEASDSSFNANLRTTVVSTNTDIGVTGAYVKSLLFYAASTGRTDVRDMAENLLDRAWALYRDDLGVSSPETRTDYRRFGDPVFVPRGFAGSNAQGANIDAKATFMSLRPKYLEDPSWPSIESFLAGGAAPSFRYHRFWAQVDLATAYATYAWLFESP